MREKTWKISFYYIRIPWNKMFHDANSTVIWNISCVFLPVSVLRGIVWVLIQGYSMCGFHRWTLSSSIALYLVFLRQSRYPSLRSICLLIAHSSGAIDVHHWLGLKLRSPGLCHKPFTHRFNLPSQLNI